MHKARSLAERQWTRLSQRVHGGYHMHSQHDIAASLPLVEGNSLLATTLPARPFLLRGVVGHGHTNRQRSLKGTHAAMANSLCSLDLTRLLWTLLCFFSKVGYALF